MCKKNIGFGRRWLPLGIQYSCIQLRQGKSIEAMHEGKGFECPFPTKFVHPVRFLMINTFTFPYHSHCDMVVSSVSPQQSYWSFWTKLLKRPALNTQDKHFSCAESDQAFKMPRELKTHVLLHKEKIPHSCRQCGLSNTSAVNLINTCVITVERSLLAVHSVSTLAQKLII